MKTETKVIAVTLGILFIFGLVGLVLTRDGSTTQEETIFCAQDVMLCSDGSYVSRTPPDCNFAQCPAGEPIENIQ